MADASSWITAIATFFIAITAIISSYYYYKLFKATIAKDKPFIRAYIRDCRKSTKKQNIQNYY